MDTFKTIVIAAILSIAASVGVVVGFMHQPTSATQSVRLGSLTGPDISSPYLAWGGLAQYNGRANMAAGTTTLCAIQSPNATTSLIFAGWDVSAGTSTAANIDLATSTNQNATTTNPSLVPNFSLASNAIGGVSWTPSGTNGTIGPLTWVIVKTDGAGLSGYTFSGTCSASFDVI